MAQRRRDRDSFAPRQAVGRNGGSKAPLRDSMMPDEQFVEWFSLIFDAMNHELRGSLGVFCAADIGKKDGKSAAKELGDTYNRIYALRGLLRKEAPNGRTLSLFPPADLTTLGIKRDGVPGTANIAMIKKVGIAEVRKFRELLPEACTELKAVEGMSDYFPQADRCVECGQMLCAILEKLMMGDRDFEPKVISQKINDETGKAVSRYWQRAASDTGCEALHNFSEEHGSVAVMVNPFFCALIFHNIFSNAKRAIDIVNAAKDNDRGEGVRITEKVEPVVDVSIYIVNDTVGLRFTDYGCGMDDEIMCQLNLGVGVSTKPDDSGEHGVGFEYCRELAKKMGGSLFVEESEKGKGTSVVLELKRIE